MLQHQEPQSSGGAPPQFRIDGQVHQLLMKPPAKPTYKPEGPPQSLPEPVFPQRQYVDGREMTPNEYHWFNAKRGLRGWAVPYFKSRWYTDRLRPIIAYLFTEFKCNVDCHYCWSYNNAVKGMTEDVARRSIDWLRDDLGCGVLALMGGEPLLRPKFAHKVVYHAAKKGFFVYLPTNGRLMRPDVIDRLGDAGLAILNLAVDAIDEKPGLPKALNPIRPYFDYLIKNQRKYGYTVAFNINICRHNRDDVRELTKIGRENGIATDYHINEAPMIQQDHFQHLQENATYLRPEDYAATDELLDELMALQAQGYKMINPRQQFMDMKDLMRGEVRPWTCRAGQNTMIIRTDGTLAPCFPMYSATHDWGTVGHEKFDPKQLDQMKESCNRHCLSTCNYILSYCYDNSRVVNWLAKQVVHNIKGFKGTTGAFE